MEIQSFLIKYGEIGIKGKNRHLFEEALVRQIRFALKGADGTFRVYRNHGRIYVDGADGFDPDEAMDALGHVFGIVGICPVVVREKSDGEALRRDVLAYAKDLLAGQDGATFKMDVRRADKYFPGNSMEWNAGLGEIILDAVPTSRVDVHHPDHTIHVEIRDRVYLYSRILPGPGGMPVGTNGSAMLLLSGGIDSPVAGYMVAKRGVRLEAVYFHAPPYTSERAKEKVITLARQVAQYAGPIRVHVVNFTDIQLAIYEKCPHDELTIIMRRYMMRIAEYFAVREGCLGLITGESIGQVASQTMQSLAATNAVCTLPVYRPLIGMDKKEIVQISEQIGTYETSILPFEDCCTIFVAKHPVTKPSISRMERSEEKLADCIDALVEEAIASVEIVDARPE